jgi:cystathionine beta-lyase/cystathionine gamma-synthase
MKTLALRMESSRKRDGLAEWLSHHPAVAPSICRLPDHPRHELNARQASGFGS